MKTKTDSRTAVLDLGERPDASGFALIELLVVIVAAAMLAALLMPFSARSKQRGQGAMCLSNLKQLSTAWMAYTGDNRGKLVPNGLESEQPVSLTDPNGLPGGSLAQWCPGRQDLVSELSPSGSAANVGDRWIELGLLYPYINNIAVYKCPADQSSAIATGLAFPHVRSISMNTWLSPIEPYQGITTVESYYKDSDLVRPGPSQFFVFMDENPLSIAGGSFICEVGVEDWIQCPASWHNHAGGISFADGHAQLHRWTDQTVIVLWAPPTIQPGNPAYVRLAPSQNPPIDLSFLQNAGTYVK